MDESRPLRSTRRLSNRAWERPLWYTISNSAAGVPTQVSIYDEIGFYGVSAGQFMADMDAITGDIEMHINSPGGDIYDGITIYNRLKQRKGSIAVVVDGLAASAASFIAMAASRGKLEMAPRSEMMIHNGFTMAIGDAADLRKMADLLDRKTADIADIYAERSGKPADYWLGKMQAETWYSAKDAVADGLADKISGQEEDSPQNGWDLSVFSHAPAVIRGANGGLASCDPDGDGDDDSSPETDTDHDYWDEDGNQIQDLPGRPMPQQDRAAPQLRNADKYNADDRKRMAGNGQAMDDGSYPIADEEDLGNAIHAVGRGGADHDAIRAHIIKRADALGLSSRIPDNWNSDGSLKATNTLSRFVCLDDAMFENIRAALKEAQ
jgi:ATP-dependent Clp endopeptidase proteolytic subunit ClpP